MRAYRRKIIEICKSLFSRYSLDFSGDRQFTKHVLMCSIFFYFPAFLTQNHGMAHLTSFWFWFLVLTNQVVPMQVFFFKQTNRNSRYLFILFPCSVGTLRVMLLVKCGSFFFFLVQLGMIVLFTAELWTQSSV